MLVQQPAHLVWIVFHLTQKKDQEQIKRIKGRTCLPETMFYHFYITGIAPDITIWR